MNIVVDTPLKVGQIFDVAGIGLNDDVYRFRLPCGCLYNRFIGQINPKRLQREINSQLQVKGIGTKAQQALKLQREQGKIERKIRSREQKEAEKERQYALRQEKKKAKHKGR